MGIEQGAYLARERWRFWVRLQHEKIEMDQPEGASGPSPGPGEPEEGPLVFLGVQRIPTRSGLGIAMGITVKGSWKAVET